jgi:hypothetical protein
MPSTIQLALASASKSVWTFLIRRPGRDAGTQARDGQLASNAHRADPEALPSVALDSGIPAGMTGFAVASPWRSGSRR